MRHLFGRILRWTLGALGATAVLGAVLFLYAAHQPRGLVTVDEVIAPGEDAAIMRLVRAATESLDQRAKDDHPTGAMRTEPHGARCRTQVDPKIGIHATSLCLARRRHQAWVRFSNAT
jgi:hypothetical protein